jgi:hypothetical protein
VQGFEAGDPSFTHAGDASSQGTFQGEAAPQGSNQYLVTTIGTNSNNEDTLTPISGTPAAGFSALNTFFGTTVTNEEGSGVVIPFTVLAGDSTLSFQYDFLSNEPGQATPRNDFGFEGLFNSGGALLGSINNFVNVNTASFTLFGAQSPFTFHTGYQTLNLDVSSLAPGNYELGIGVSDAVNTSHASALLIDNVQVSAVPEPSTLGLMLAGAAGFAAIRRRIRK